MIRQQEGYITLFSILVISAIAVTLTLTIILIGIGTSRSSLTSGQSRSVNSLAHACAEEALEKIRDNTAYTGTGSLTLDGNNCTYTVTSTGSQTRTIDAGGTIGEVTRRVKVLVGNVSPLTIASWQEVADY